MLDFIWIWTIFAYWGYVMLFAQFKELFAHDLKPNVTNSDRQALVQNKRDTFLAKNEFSLILKLVI